MSGSRQASAIAAASDLRNGRSVIWFPLRGGSGGARAESCTTEVSQGDATRGPEFARPIRSGSAGGHRSLLMPVAKNAGSVGSERCSTCAARSPSQESARVVPRPDGRHGNDHLLARGPRPDGLAIHGEFFCVGIRENGLTLRGSRPWRGIVALRSASGQAYDDRADRTGQTRAPASTRDVGATWRR
jgi:hypothetical protein